MARRKKRRVPRKAVKPLIADSVPASEEPFDPCIPQQRLIQFYEAFKAMLPVVLPSGFEVEGALKDPVTERELELPLRLVDTLKKRDRWRNETYPERAAAIALSLLAKETWAPATRNGAAWAYLYMGLYDHDFGWQVPASARFLRCGSDFFQTYDTVPKLAALLREACQDVDDYRRAWAMDKVARQRHKRQADALERQLLMKRTNQPPVVGDQTRVNPPKRPKRI
jgi:hypothetical protein